MEEAVNNRKMVEGFQKKERPFHSKSSTVLGVVPTIDFY